MLKANSLINIPEVDREKIREKLKQCLEREETIIFAYLHGSFAEKRPFRDIDIAAYIDEKQIARERRLDFEFSVSTRLETNIGFPIDLRIINYASLSFQYYSTSGILLFCRDENVHVAFLAKTRSLYLDFKPSSERFLKEMLHAE